MHIRLPMSKFKIATELRKMQLPLEMAAKVASYDSRFYGATEQDIYTYLQWVYGFNKSRLFYDSDPE